MAAAEFTQLGARHLKAALVAIDGGHSGAGLREVDGNGAADAAAPARHHAGAACEAKPVG